MKKRFAKLAALTGVLVIVALSAVGCKKVECDICGEVKKCSTEEILGKEYHICNDCEKQLEEFSSLFE